MMLGAGLVGLGVTFHGNCVRQLGIVNFQTIEASLSTPEKMSSGLAEMMKKSDANPESLEKPLRDLLKKNGVTPEGLEKVRFVFFLYLINF